MSKSYTVAIPLDPKLAESIGKKGSENSITFYNRKVDDDVVVALAPTSIEQKFYAAAEALLVSDQVVVSTANIDQLFGEIVIACSLIDKRTLFTDDNDISAMLKGIMLSDYQIVSKQQILEKIMEYKPVQRQDLRVDIDKAFPVKGIGVVALGIVTGGTLNVHDTLYHSSGKQVLIRSIQSQDKDIQSAAYATRVGVALKGIEHDELSKGDILTKQKMPNSQSLKIKIKTSKLAAEQISTGNYYSLYYNFLFTAARVESIQDDIVELRAERPHVMIKGDTVLLGRQKVPRIFASGTIL